MSKVLMQLEAVGAIITCCTRCGTVHIAVVGSEDYHVANICPIIGPEYNCGGSLAEVEKGDDNMEQLVKILSALIQS